MVEDSDYSDKSELHKENCPIREIMEVRLRIASLIEKTSILPKGIIVRVGGFPYELAEDTKVYLKE